MIQCEGISGLDTGPRTNRSCTENLHESSLFKGNFSGQVRDSTIDHRLRILIILMLAKTRMLHLEFNTLPGVYEYIYIQNMLGQKEFKPTDVLDLNT